MPCASVSENPTRVTAEYLNGGLRSVRWPSSSSNVTGEAYSAAARARDRARGLQGLEAVLALGRRVGDCVVEEPVADVRGEAGSFLREQEAVGELALRV